MATTQVSYEVYYLDLATNRWTKIEGESPHNRGGVQSADKKPSTQSKKQRVSAKPWLAPPPVWSLGEANTPPQFLPQPLLIIAAKRAGLKPATREALELALKSQWGRKNLRPQIQNS